MATLPIVLVVAVAENGVIGRRGGLPWRFKADLARFRAVTMGKPLIMGRVTFESIGRPLDGRDSIVVTRRPGFAASGIRVARDLTDALSQAEASAEASGATEFCAIGGAAIFREMLPLAASLHVTHVEGRPDGDVHFAFDPSAWREVSRQALPSAPGDTATGSYAVYERQA